MTSSTGSAQLDPAYGDFLKGMALRQETEYERLRLQHELHKTAMSGKLVQVPLSTTRPLRILDSGTGDGTWMVDVSKQYPQAELVGTDIFQKHFEQLKDVPKCISFKVQSVLDDWPAEDHEAYDLVHQRYCLAQFSAEKDAAIVMRLFGNVKPGGYLQIVDANLGGFDGGEGHEAMVKAMDYFIKAFTEHGLEPRPGPSAAEWMRQAGAVDIHEEVMSFNVGIKATTPEDQTGTTVNLTTIIDNFAAIGSRDPNYWYTPNDFMALKNGIIEEMAKTGNTWRFWVITGKKPA
ncbi:S-adenosyl-L-methionine-dependent methyltransferase [Glarea lozoyensis ATCC 20868]|uniref:S-adenosyl-L-methionine-dependent methyltransferase n=1 Tax=Glarea lozoyensis (strain ATCC 20868 / MF5171) TaxID=1116229 RepID=S3DWN3_GLAL2|nr:S-adenosyl-L-methionine-dependent methyltransferase [Glarea lozoyensis ATCC 20868]EPE30773.1 S-adenosyl-L-methionine-dependent methyltransferase [Glarea lozoyensis ATCC 20868]